jgi:hypothetical protein
LRVLSSVDLSVAQSVDVVGSVDQWVLSSVDLLLPPASVDFVGRFVGRLVGDLVG